MDFNNARSNNWLYKWVLGWWRWYVYVPTLSNIVGLSEKKAHATAILIMLPLSIVSFVIYIIMGAFDGMTTLKVTIGFVIGSAVGALILKNIKNIVLNIIFAVVIIASGIKLLI